jgi:hypothetical protein
LRYCMLFRVRPQIVMSKRKRLWCEEGVDTNVSSGGSEGHVKVFS